MSVVPKVVHQQPNGVPIVRPERQLAVANANPTADEITEVRQAGEYVAELAAETTPSQVNTPDFYPTLATLLTNSAARAKEGDVVGFDDALAVARSLKPIICLNP